MSSLTRAFVSRAQINQIASQILGAILPGRPEQGVLEESDTQNFELGARLEHGLCVYRYGLAGAVDITVGTLCQSPVPAAAQIDLVPSTSYAVGTRVINVTLGAAVTANEYAGGWLYVNDGTGQGQKLTILSHPAAAGGAACAFTCLEGLTIALDTADSLISLVANPWSQVIIHPSPPTAGLTGVPNRNITAAHYGWFQTRGPCPVLIDGTVYIYQEVIPSSVVDGAVVAASHSHTALTLDSGDGVRDIAAGDDMQKLRDGAGAAIDTAEVCTGGAASGAKDAAIPTSSDLVPGAVGRVMRVNADTDYGLTFLTLE